MPAFNAGSAFKNKKRLSAPTIHIPKSVKEALMIESASPGGIFKIEPGGVAMYDQCYIFEDVNYINQDIDKKDTLLKTLMKFFKLMTFQYKITVVNEYKHLDELINEVYSPVNTSEYSSLSEGIGEWITKKVKEGVRDIRKVYYLTVTCRAESYEDAAAFFATLDSALQGIFTDFHSSLYKMSGIERLRLLQMMWRQEKGVDMDPPEENDDGWKNTIMPTSIEQFKDYMIFDNHYVSVLFGHDFGRTLDDEKVLNQLKEMPFPIYITLDIEPVEKTILQDKLEVANMNNDRAISQEKSRRLSMGQVTIEASYTLSKKKEKIEEHMERVDENDEQAVFLGFLVVVYAASLDELIQRVQRVQNAAKSASYILDTYNMRQLKAMNTAMPVGGRHVNHMRAFLTSEAVAFNPFNATDIKEPGGYIYGINRTTKNIIQGNRKKLKNPHCIINGHSGSGKTYFVKTTELSQTLLCTNDDVWGIDPQNEYKDIVEAEGGQFFDLTPQSQFYINPLEVPEGIINDDVIKRNIFIADKKDYAVCFTTACMSKISTTQSHNTYIHRAVDAIYSKFFEEKNPKKRQQPTLVDLWINLKGQLEAATMEAEQKYLLDIVNSLEQFATGVYDMFSKESNLDIHSRCVFFGIKNIPSTIWEPVMTTVTHFLQEHIKYNVERNVATHLIIDEAQVMFNHEASIKQVRQLTETYRKFGGMITLIMQNFVKAIDSSDLKSIFSNCEFKVFFDQGGVDAMKLSEIQEFSDVEFKALSEEHWGRGVMVWGKKVVMFDCEMDTNNLLYDRFSTNFHEKAEQRRRLLEIENNEQQSTTADTSGQLKNEETLKLMNDINGLLAINEMDIDDISSLFQVPNEFLLELFSKDENIIVENNSVRLKGVD